MTVTLAVGTVKGAFLYRSDDRRSWELAGPQHKGWEVTAFGRTPGGDYLLATGSSWYGAAVHRSHDLVEWEQVLAGPAYPEASGHKLSRIWSFTTHGDTIFAGVDDAGLFRSDDNGTSWEPVTGLNDHPTREAWQPGFGGLAAHRILVDPTDPDRLWCAISAVGVFRSDDGGETWAAKNDGVPVTSPSIDYPDIGFCVHGIALDPERPDLMWRQDHQGVFRSSDGGDRWERIEAGLPSYFGFPMIRDHHSGHLFVIPLESDEYRMPVNARLRVFRSTNSGDSWSPTGPGIPDEPTYITVLRGAMIADQLDPGGVYLGTTAGKVHYSRDLGTEWHTLPGTLPRVSTVAVFTA
jgi:photosystem II stability/assembly factor-like uncharacterized protein